MEKYLLETDYRIRKKWQIFFFINLTIVLSFFYVVHRNMEIVTPIVLIFFYLIYSMIFYRFSYQSSGTKLLIFHYLLGPLLDFFVLFLITLFSLAMFGSSPGIEIWLFLKLFGFNLLIFLPILFLNFFWYRNCFRLRKVNLLVKKLLQNSSKS